MSPNTGTQTVSAPAYQPDVEPERGNTTALIAHERDEQLEDRYQREALTNGALSPVTTDGDTPRPSSIFSAALSGLSQVLRAEPDLELWQEGARRLRAATVQEQRRSRRHAALTLLLADALSYTAPADLSKPGEARDALALGWRALAEPFISTETERRVSETLAEAGWQLTLPYRRWTVNK